MHAGQTALAECRGVPCRRAGKKMHQSASSLWTPGCRPTDYHWDLPWPHFNVADLPPTAADVHLFFEEDAWAGRQALAVFRGSTTGAEAGTKSMLEPAGLVSVGQGGRQPVPEPASGAAWPRVHTCYNDDISHCTHLSQGCADTTALLAWNPRRAHCIPPACRQLQEHTTHLRVLTLHCGQRLWSCVMPGPASVAQSLQVQQRSGCAPAIVSSALCLLPLPIPPGTPP